MAGQRFNDRKKVWSALKWNVLYGPSLYKRYVEGEDITFCCKLAQGTEIAFSFLVLGAGHSWDACLVLALRGLFATHIAYADDA